MFIDTAYQKCYDVTTLSEYYLSPNAYNIWNVLRCPSGPGSFIFYGGFMEEKAFKTLDELVDILKQRGIDIPDSSARDYAKRVLEKKMIL